LAAGLWFASLLILYLGSILTSEMAGILALKHLAANRTVTMTPTNYSPIEAVTTNKTFLPEANPAAVDNPQPALPKLIAAGQSRDGMKPAGLLAPDAAGPVVAASVEAPEDAAPPRDFIWYSRTYSVFLTAEEAVLTVTHPGSYGPGHKWFERDGERGGPAENIAIVRMKLLGSNPESSGAVSSGGKKPANRTLGTESQVRYRDIYPGIDIVYHSDLHRLKYDFVLTSGGDPKLIRLRFAGADGIRADKNGTLLLQVPGGRLRWQEPVIYREQAGHRLKVAGRYVINGVNEVSFAGTEISAAPLTSAAVAPAIPIAP
jgi:hypothetical protein